MPALGVPIEQSAHEQVPVLTMQETTDGQVKASPAEDSYRQSSAESGPTLKIILLNPNCPDDTQAEQTKVEEMNALVRSNPAMLTDLVKQTLASRFAQQGTYLDGDDRVTFGPSHIPFHTVFTLLCENRKLCHLASAKNKKLANPVSSHSTRLQV